MIESQFVAQILHKVNNDVGVSRIVLRDVCEELSDFLESNKPLNKKLNLINNRLEEVLTFLRALRQTLVLENDIKSIEIWSIIQAALKLIVIRENIELDLNENKNIPNVLGTPTLIEVIRNVITNAVQAMPSGGKLRISGPIF